LCYAQNHVILQEGITNPVTVVLIHFKKFHIQIICNQSLKHSTILHQGDQDRMIDGRCNAKGSIAMMLVDYKEDLRVLTVFDPPIEVPLWNKFSQSDFNAIFDFADNLIQDDGAMVIIYTYNVEAKTAVLGYAKTYRFVERKNWVWMNCFHLCYLAYLQLTVCLTSFFIKVYNFSLMTF
jgi:hypothetical protein